MRRVKGSTLVKIQALRQLEVGCALVLHPGSSTGITLHPAHHKRTQRGIQKVLEKSAPHPHPAHPHPFCPWELPNPEEKPSSEAHWDLHLSGLPVAAGM